MSNIHRKKKSESESSDWEDETFLPVDEQDEYLQETYGNELPKLRWVLHFAVKVRYLKILGWLWSWVPTSDGCHWVSSRQWLGQPSEYGVCIIHSLICVCWQLCTRCIVQQVIFSSSPEEIANPSRADPREFEPKVTLEKNSTRTLTRNGVVTLCVTYGFVLESYIGEGKSPQGWDKTSTSKVSHSSLLIINLFLMS